MDYRAWIGGIELSLSATGTASAPAFHGYPVAHEGQGQVQSVEEDSAVFLVLDYRGAVSVPSTAYVEWWTPVVRVEGTLRGMVILAASHAATEAPAVSTLSGLVQAIAG
jgi:hypothetical protein